MNGTQRCLNTSKKKPIYRLKSEQNVIAKKIDPTDFHNKLAQRLPQYRGRWKTSMADQIQDLPDFDQVEREVMRHLKKLELA